MSQLNQGVHSLVSSRVGHVDQVSEVGNRIVEGGVAQLLEQTALQLNCNLLQRYNSNCVSALKGLAEALYATLLLALDVGRRLVYGLFQQA